MSVDHSTKRNIQLPDSPDECFGVGIKVIQNAYMSKMQSLEHDVRAQRLSLDQEKAAHMQTMKRANTLDVELIDSREQCKKLQEENRNLIQNLRAQNQQLEQFERLKQTLVGGLDSFQSEFSRVNDGDTNGYADTRFLRRESFLQGIAPMAASAAPPPMCTTPVGSASVYGSFNNSNQHNGSQFGGLSNPGAFPNTMPSTSNTSPVNNSTSSISGIGLLQQKTQDSTMRDVSGDSAGGRASAVDGKSFFKMARSRLSNDTFDKFLASIKRLNAQEQSTDETLADVKKIFDQEGEGYDDLYSDFAALLHRRD